MSNTVKVKVLLSSLMLTLLVSCGGGNQYMKGVKVTTSDVAGDTYLSVEAKLNMQNLLLAEISIPVTRNGVQIGTVALGPDLFAGNRVEVSLNMSALTGIMPGINRLPNGLAIPLIGSNSSISIKAGSGIQIYLVKAEDVLGLAVSINVKEFDGMGRSIGTTGIFPMFNVDQVVGAAGIYTSRLAGQNGIALAFNLSNYLPSEEQSVLRAGMVLDKPGSVELEYSVEDKASSRQKRKLARKMSRLSRDGTVLHSN